MFHTFYTPSVSGSLIIAIKPKASKKFARLEVVIFPAALWPWG
jgi:hypothetical protein